ncbi:hypothetical protein [Capnocytophaga catalasegens]|uniref:Uncharacterized protein n=1 Tax=Capnocytophaga catalasegens TaxID=1004260 RepID=A0AAV5AV24_9FLAO|nr:hypothetical protein [Capnocytophaga catalasegens]GIZ15290.1 hypothetical protein RCZ03_12900 [Capnocytophaga catalasegens]GJM51224.1 hypothetical protein RCZ15_21970 [Capnocytophaga catalasegens]GJM53018.1 hypothetical protein RCZ16_13350 [Capnocytophaga catalasegens]
MNFLKKIFSKGKNHTNKTEENTNTINIDIDLSKESIRQSIEEAKIERSNIWKYIQPKIDFYDSKGNPIFETDWVNQSERKEVGFLGKKIYSENKKFCVVGVASDSGLYNIALVDVELQKVLYKKKYNNPSVYAVSNNGKIAFVERLQNSDRISILNQEGDKIFEKRHNYFISDTPFEFTKDDTMFIYELHTNHKIIKIDL